MAPECTACITIAQRSKKHPNPTRGKGRREGGYPVILISPGTGKSQGCYLDLDDSREQGPEDAGRLRKLLANKEATEAGLELDDKADVGLPEQLAVMGSGDLGDG